MNTIFQYIKILRPLNVLFTALSVIITAYLTESLCNTTIIINTILVVAFFTGASNILNDIFDLSIDKKNKPERPLASEKITLMSAWIYMLIMYILGILFLFSLPRISILIALFIVLPLLIIYTPYIKRIPLVGNIVISLMLGMVFLFSESAFTGTLDKMWVPAWLAFGLSFIRELIKDIEDVEGDKLEGAYTFPAVFGIERSLHLVYVLTILFCLIWWAPYYNHTYGNIYALLLLFTVEIPLIFSIFFLWKNPTSSSCAIISRASKWITLNGMITILCSSL